MAQLASARGDQVSAAKLQATALEIERQAAHLHNVFEQAPVPIE